MNRQDDDRIEAQVRRALNAAAEELDADTRRRLAQARYAALDALPRARGFRWGYAAGGVAATLAVAVLAASLWWTPPETNALPEQSLADLDLLATPDNPEFYVELEFYEWLASPGHAG